MKLLLALIASVLWCFPALAEDDHFSAHLYAKFQARGCTNCHDFFVKERGGKAFADHQGRNPAICVLCHGGGVTGFVHPDNWYARPGLYTSGMSAQQTCEAVMAAQHAAFKNRTLVARELKKHLLGDPRVLWGIEGATPHSGMLPAGQKEPDLVPGGLNEWREQVRAWIDGGMKCP